MNIDNTIELPRITVNFLELTEWFYQRGRRAEYENKGTYHEALGEWLDGRKLLIDVNVDIAKRINGEGLREVYHGQEG